MVSDYRFLSLTGRVSRHLAVYLAPSYHMADLIDVSRHCLRSALIGQSLARAVPDPGVQYRKSQRSQQAAEEIVRHREPRAVPSLATAEAPSPAPKRVRRAEVDDDTTTAVSNSQPTADATAHAGEEHMDAEIAQAKQLVKELKRAIETREAQEERGADLSESQRGIKRGQAFEDGVSVSGSSGQGRIIKSNKRVKESSVLLGGVKTVAYGSLILGIGLGLGA